MILMPGEWTEMVYIVIPIALRDQFGGFALKVMGDRDDDKMFDSIRLSASGKEPATHLGTVCPCTKKQAALWRDLLLDSEAKPGDYPNDKADTKDKVFATTAKLDLKHISVLANRLDGLVVKPSKDIRVIESKHNTMKAINSPQQLWDYVGLQRIITLDEGDL